MKQFLKVTAMVVIGFIVGSFLIGFSIGVYQGITEQTQTKTEPKVVTPTTKDDTPVKPTTLSKTEREAFMSTCDAEGNMTAYCNCTLDNLEQTVGRDGIIKIGLEAESGQIPQEMYDAASACYDKL